MEQFLDYFIPESYDLIFNIDKSAGNLSGQVILKGRSAPNSPTPVIKLHTGSAMDFHLVSYNNEPTNIGTPSDSPHEIKHHVSIKNHTLIISGVNPDPNQLTTIQIIFSTKIKNNMEGAYFSTYQHKGKTETIVATQFESHYARECFPCIDEPAAKATFNLSLIVSDPEDVVLSNMPIATEYFLTDFCEDILISKTQSPPFVQPIISSSSNFQSPSDISPKNPHHNKPNKPFYRQINFAKTPRMSTYLLAFVVGKFHGQTIENANGTKITTYAPLNQPLSSVDFANYTAARALEYYDSVFGVPYPLPKLDQVALPDFEAGAMENWGLVTYRESMLLADKTASLSTKKSIALTVTHELSHQWFGNLVTMRWWDELWLNESFASIMEYFAADFLYPDYRIWESFFTGDCLAALRRDALKNVQSVHQPVKNPAEIATLFDGAIVYAKGARLMLMLIRAMGWDNFKQGIKGYFKKHQYQNTVGDNLWDALKPYANFDPKTFIHAWIKNPGFPVISDEKQQRFLLDGPLKPSSWPLPSVKDDMSGHYVLNLTPAKFAEKLANFSGLGLEEKLRLLIDRSFIVKTPLAPSSSLLELIALFKTEDSAAIWSIIASVISDLKIFFEPNSSEEKAFKNFVNDLISAKLLEIGLTPPNLTSVPIPKNPTSNSTTQKTTSDLIDGSTPLSSTSDTTPPNLANDPTASNLASVLAPQPIKESDNDNILRLRSILLSLNFYAENQNNLRRLANLYQDDLKKLDPEIRPDILNAKIYLEPEAINVFLEKYTSTSDPELKFDLLVAMSLSKTPKNLKMLISLLKKPQIIKPQDHLYLFLFLFRNPISRKETFTWLTKNWDYVVGLAGDKSIDSYPRYIASSIRTTSEKTAFFDFFAPKKSHPALKRTLKIAASEIDARLRLISADSPAIFEYLTKFSA